jgi:hypothetical protein
MSSIAEPPRPNQVRRPTISSGPTMVASLVSPVDRMQIASSNGRPHAMEVLGSDGDEATVGTHSNLI